MIPQIAAGFLQLAPTIWATLNGAALLGFAGFGVWIAYRQSVTARTKVQLDLYDKRYPVFVAARDFISHVTTHGNMTDAALVEYIRTITAARFLFDAAMLDYLKSLKNAGIEIQALHDTFQPLPVGEQRAALARQKGDRVIWVVEQFDLLEDKFAPYMQLEARRGKVRQGRA
jgi:hypothetical protein